MNYHVHVYWNTASERIWALHLRSKLRKLGCTIGYPYDIPIGPHPIPMFRATYTSDNQSEVESMITAHRSGLSVLLHESINNDVRDHTEGARWLGEPVALDLEWLATNQDN